ncbi:hypothetical protein JHK86_007645 [Glycine max]|nr:hypothetical protein JHK86_007645 [Glycine max]
MSKLVWSVLTVVKQKDPLSSEAKLYWVSWLVQTSSIGSNQQHYSSNKVGCLFFAKVGDGTCMQALGGSTQTRVGAFQQSHENPTMRNNILVNGET